MLKNFKDNITKNKLFTKTDKLLLAFSGGVDSVVLAELLHDAGYQFEMAHCNFKLRGEEADGDTHFCESYAQSISTNCYVKYFDTKEYALQQKISVQMAARELRYNWFNELVKQHNYTYILTAHHANDNIETLFVNLVRGTGIKGLQGIPEKQNTIVRPLLFAKKEDITYYAAKHELKYREDSSNVEVKYKRNFIRHEIIPSLKKLNPALEETLSTSIQFFKQSAQIVAEYAAEKYTTICKEEVNILFIDIKLLVLEKQKETLLFEWLYNKQFKTKEIKQLSEAIVLQNNVGKQFYSSTHRLLIDREYIIVKAIPITEEVKEYIILTLDDVAHLPINLRFEEKTDSNFLTHKNEISIPYSADLFPLTLRRWQQGDKFKPFGMDNLKKLSDFFKDRKLSLFDKETIWILESKHHIIWLVGLRMDNRCKIINENDKMIKIIYTN